MSLVMFFVVQLLSRVWLFASPWAAALQASWNLLKLMPIKSVMPSNHRILCRPLLLPPSVFPRIRVFSSESVLRGPGIGASASASVLPMNIQDWSPLGLPGWISLQSKGLSRVFSYNTVQKHQFFGHSAFFIVHLSHPSMTTEKTIALTRRTFVGKVMSLLFNKLSRLVIAFLPRSKHLFMAAVTICSDFGAQKKVSYFHCFPIYLPWKWWDQMPWS